MPNLKCKICGIEFPPIKERHYVAIENALIGEPTFWDAFDCPNCGCQIVVQQRKHEYEEATDEELLVEMDSKTIAEHLGISPNTVGHLRAAKNSSWSTEIYKHLDNALNQMSEQLSRHFNCCPPCESNHTSFVKPMKKPSSLYFITEDEAATALKAMRKMVEENGFISINMVNEILGGEHHILSKWGWTDLSKAHVVKSENYGGYYISFPSVICDRPKLGEVCDEL